MMLWDDKRNSGIWQTYSRAVKEETRWKLSLERSAEGNSPGAAQPVAPGLRGCWGVHHVAVTGVVG